MLQTQNIPVKQNLKKPLDITFSSKIQSLNIQFILSDPEFPPILMAILRHVAAEFTYQGEDTRIRQCDIAAALGYNSRTYINEQLGLLEAKHLIYQEHNYVEDFQGRRRQIESSYWIPEGVRDFFENEAEIVARNSHFYGEKSPEYAYQIFKNEIMHLELRTQNPTPHYILTNSQSLSIELLADTRGGSRTAEVALCLPEEEPLNGKDEHRYTSESVNFAANDLLSWGERLAKQCYDYGDPPNGPEFKSTKMSEAEFFALFEGKIDA